MLKNFEWPNDARFVLLAKYYYGDEMKEYEMGGECGTHGKEDKYIRRFWWENLKEIDPLEKKI